MNPNFPQYVINNKTGLIIGGFHSFQAAMDFAESYPPEMQESYSVVTREYIAKIYPQYPVEGASNHGKG
jgi:hypothetical protein